MNKEEALESIKKVKENSQKRKFNQAYDLIITLKGLDLKKSDQHVDFFMDFNFPVKKKSICALVGPELSKQAKESCEEVVDVDDFLKYGKDKKLIKELAEKHDFFIAQATIMPKVAQTFGRIFGPKGKMPNPKSGCVVPPNANIKQVYNRLQVTVNIKAKSHLMIQAIVGKEDMNEDDVAENMVSVYNQVIHHLPQEKNNVRRILLKLTMGTPVSVGKEEEPEKSKEKSKPAKKVKKGSGKQKSEKTEAIAKEEKPSIEDKK